MPYRVRPDGLIECDTAEEAITLQALKSGARPINARAEVLRGRSTNKAESILRVVSFLEIIRAAGSTHMPSAELAKRLGLPDGRGIGGYTSAANKMLKEYGINSDRVVAKKQGRDGSWQWSAERDLDAAITKLRSEAEKEENK